MNVRDRATGLKTWVNTTVYLPNISQIFGIMRMRVKGRRQRELKMNRGKLRV